MNVLFGSLLLFETGSYYVAQASLEPCSPGWPGTPFVNEDSLEALIPCLYVLSIRIPGE